MLVIAQVVLDAEGRVTEARTSDSCMGSHCRRYDLGQDPWIPPPVLPCVRDVFASTPFPPFGRPVGISIDVFPVTDSGR